MEAGVRERPILFSAPMVRAILAGTKTQTRRALKPQPTEHGDGMLGHVNLAGHFAPHVFGYCAAKMIPCPYGAPGDRLWVRETVEHADNGTGSTAIYSADCDTAPCDRWVWQRRVLPAIHMPRGMSRITLEVTGVRVERLHAITEDDARAEGVDGPHSGRWTDLEGRLTPPESAPARPWAHSFFVAWSEINGRDSLWANPWVWVVEFRRVEAQERAA